MRRLIAGVLLAAVLTLIGAPALTPGAAHAAGNPLQQLEQVLAQVPDAAGDPSQFSTSSRGLPSEQKFRNTVWRLLFLEMLRLILLQLAGVDLSALGDGFWFQLYLRVVAQGLDATLVHDTAAGTITLVRGTVKVIIQQGDNVIIISNGTTTVTIPGNLGGTAAGAFWQVADLIRALIQAGPLVPMPPAPAR